MHEFKLATERNAGTGIQNRQRLHRPIKTEIKPGTRFNNKPMNKIPVNWLCGPEAVAEKVAIFIRSLESPIDSILQKGIRDARSLSEIQKLNMEHMRQWEKFPVRILRSL